MDAFLSDKFRFWSFVAMCLLVFVHGYNLQESYLQPWTFPGEPMTITTFVEYWTANGLLRFRIPLLFLISGYLFALGDHKPTADRLGKRSKSLLLPYLWWSGIALVFLWLLEYAAWGKSLVLSSHLAQIDDQRMLISEYRWWEVLLRWLLAPVAYQLWFVRSLFVYNLLYPVLRWLVLHRVWRWVFWVGACCLWISTFGFVIEGEGLLFFSLGIWWQKSGFTFDRRQRWLHPLPWVLLVLGLSIWKTWVAFQPMYPNGYRDLTLLHKAVVLTGLIAAWTSLDRVVQWAMGLGWFRRISAFSFMIYGVHTPLVVLLYHAAFLNLPHFAGYRLVWYLLIPLVVIAFAVFLGWGVRRFWPWLYAQLTGGRGLTAP